MTVTALSTSEGEGEGTPLLIFSSVLNAPWTVKHIIRPPMRVLCNEWRGSAHLVVNPQTLHGRDAAPAGANYVWCEEESRWSTLDNHPPSYCRLGWIHSLFAELSLTGVPRSLIAPRINLPFFSQPVYISLHRHAAAGEQLHLTFPPSSEKRSLQPG